HMRRICGDRGRPAQRNRDIGLLQRDRIVYAVADKADLAAFPLQLLDVIRLVGGQHLGEVAIHPELLGKLAVRGLVVSRYDRNVLDAAFPQTSDNAADLGPYRRAQLEGAAELVVYRD